MEILYFIGLLIITIATVIIAFAVVFFLGITVIALIKPHIQSLIDRYIEWWEGRME